MTTELTKAAQQAIPAIDALLRNIRRNAHQLSGKVMGDAENASAELRRALTQRPAAQTEREAVRWEICKHCGHDMKEPCHHNLNPNAARNCRWNREDTRVLGTGLVNNRPAPQQATPTSGNILTDAFNEVQALKQQATPEPVGEVVYQIKGDSFECPHAWRDATEEAFYTTPAADRRILYTRPAPGVPEGFALVPVVPTKAMTTAVEHAMWERPSVNGSDVWSAVLAAAQAKGGV